MELKEEVTKCGATSSSTEQKLSPKPPMRAHYGFIETEESKEDLLVYHLDLNGQYSSEIYKQILRQKCLVS